MDEINYREVAEILAGVLGPLVKDTKVFHLGFQLAEVSMQLDTSDEALYEAAKTLERNLYAGPRRGVVN